MFIIGYFVTYLKFLCYWSRLDIFLLHWTLIENDGSTKKFMTLFVPWWEFWDFHSPVVTNGCHQRMLENALTSVWVFFCTSFGTSGYTSSWWLRASLIGCDLNGMMGYFHDGCREVVGRWSVSWHQVPPTIKKIIGLLCTLLGQVILKFFANDVTRNINSWSSYLALVFIFISICT